MTILLSVLKDYPPFQNLKDFMKNLIINMINQKSLSGNLKLRLYKAIGNFYGRGKIIM